MRRLRVLLITILIIMLNLVTVAPSSVESTLEWRETQALNFLERLRYEEEYNKFKQQLGKDESSNNWLAVNTIGAIGEWQFMESTLKRIGFDNITSEKFKENPEIFSREMQEIALNTLVEMNTITMQRYIDAYEGKIIKGIKITKAGILASCHLAGPGGVKRFLLSDDNPQDIYGTTVAKYMMRYQDFDITLKLI